MVWLRASHIPPVVLVVVLLCVRVSASQHAQHTQNTRQYAQNTQQHADTQVLHFNPNATSRCVGGCSVNEPGIWLEGTPVSFNNCVIIVEPTQLIQLNVAPLSEWNITSLFLSQVELVANGSIAVVVSSVSLTNQSSVRISDSATLTVNTLWMDATSDFKALNSSNISLQQANISSIFVDENVTFYCFNCSFFGEVMNSNAFLPHTEIDNLSVFGTKTLIFLGGLKATFVGAYSGAIIVIERDHYSENIFVDSDAQIQINNAARSTFFFAEGAIYGNGTITVSADAVGFFSGSPAVANFYGMIIINYARTILFNTMYIAYITFENSQNVTVEALTVEFSQKSLNIPGNMVITDNQIVSVDGDITLDGCITLSASSLHVQSSITCKTNTLSLDASSIYLQGDLTAPAISLTGASTLNVMGGNVTSHVIGDIIVGDYSNVTIAYPSRLDVTGYYTQSSLASLILLNMTTDSIPIALHQCATINGTLYYDTPTLVNETYIVLTSDQNVTGQFINATDLTGRSNFLLSYSPHEITMGPPTKPHKSKSRIPIIDVVVGIVGVTLLLGLVFGMVIAKTRRSNRKGYSSIN